MADNRTTMLYVVAYDIPSNQRRTKAHKILSGFGHWTQYSLFECFLNEKQYLLLQARLEKVIEKNVDNIRFYPLCNACQAKVETMGSNPPQEPQLFMA
jgi:CRISPR-associated protein Cas2